MVIFYSTIHLCISYFHIIVCPISIRVDVHKWKNKNVFHISNIKDPLLVVSAQNEPSFLQLLVQIVDMFWWITITQWISYLIVNEIYINEYIHCWRLKQWEKVLYTIYTLNIRSAKKALWCMCVCVCTYTYIHNLVFTQ